MLGLGPFDVQGSDCIFWVSLCFSILSLGGTIGSLRIIIGCCYEVFGILGSKVRFLLVFAGVHAGASGFRASSLLEEAVEVLALNPTP